MVLGELVDFDKYQQIQLLSRQLIRMVSMLAVDVFILKLVLKSGLWANVLSDIKWKNSKHQKNAKNEKMTKKKKKLVLLSVRPFSSSNEKSSSFKVLTVDVCRDLMLDRLEYDHHDHQVQSVSCHDFCYLFYINLQQ